MQPSRRSPAASLMLPLPLRWHPAQKGSRMEAAAGTPQLPLMRRPRSSFVRRQEEGEQKQQQVLQQQVLRKG